MKKLLIDKEYCPEEISFIYDDIQYEVEQAINKKEIELDEHGFIKGNLSLKLIYSDLD